MIKYQLHFKGKNRAHHTFKTQDQALQHQERLIEFIKGKVSSGQLAYSAYMTEAKALQVVEIEVISNDCLFSVCEYTHGTSGVVKSFYNLAQAEALLGKLQEDSNRNFAIMRTKINDQSKNHSSKG